MRAEWACASPAPVRRSGTEERRGGTGARLEPRILPPVCSPDPPRSPGTAAALRVTRDLSAHTRWFRLTAPWKLAAAQGSTQGCSARHVREAEAARKSEVASLFPPSQLRCYWPKLLLTTHKVQWKMLLLIKRQKGVALVTSAVSKPCCQVMSLKGR